MEGDEPTLVFGIHISSFFQEILHHIQMVVATCVEGRGRDKRARQACKVGRGEENKGMREERGRKEKKTGRLLT